MNAPAIPISRLDRRRIGLAMTSASRLGGGVFEAVVKHAEVLRSLGARVSIHASLDQHSSEDRQRFTDVPVHTAPVVGPRAIAFAPAMVGSALAEELDLLHLHGIWQYPSRAATLWAERTGRPLLISPHGMLDPWITGRGRLKKALARIGYERAAWRQAFAFHALTEREAADISRETGRSDTFVIPNAGPAASAPRRSLPKPDFLFLSRIHVKKNIDGLLAAWEDVAPLAEERQATLTIVGWGADEDVAALEERMKAAPASARFIGPAFGEKKQALLESAHHLVLPSHSEGLPMTILEAWAAGTPTLMSTECNLPIGFARGAALDCGFTRQSIASALRDALALDEGQWLARSRAARALANDEFSEGAVARMWEAAYGEMLDRAAPAKGSAMNPLDASRTKPLEGGASFPLANRLARVAWGLAWLLLARWTPPPMHRWRGFVLRLFGAKVAASTRVHASVRVWLPANLELGPNTLIGPGVRLYNQGQIRIGERTVVSQGAYLCASTHDVNDPDFQLLLRPIDIGKGCWIAADAFVGPGVTMHAGSVLGARGALFEDALPDTIYRGNPASALKRRELRKDG